MRESNVKSKGAMWWGGSAAEMIPQERIYMGAEDGRCLHTVITLSICYTLYKKMYHSSSSFVHPPNKSNTTATSAIYIITYMLIDL